jgi:hypothetical protein
MIYVHAEAYERSAEMAKVQGCMKVDVEHLEAILAQLLLDF